MKKVLTLAFLSFYAGMSFAQDNYNLTGKITGLSNDTIIVISSDPVTRKSIKTDVVPVKNNMFAVNVPDDGLVSISITEKPKGKNLMRKSNLPIFLLPGERIQVKGDINNLQAYGTEIYDGLMKLTDINEAQEKLNTINAQLSAAYKAKEQQTISTLKTQSKDLAVKISAMKLAYIKQNPNTLLAGYLYQQLRSADGVEAEKLLGSNVKTGIWSEVIKMKTDSYMKQAALDKARENIQPGKSAPDFKLKNLNNEVMSLASFKGKYVLLDFWGTWCGWCIKGMPDMKTYYGKYKDKIEFVGICCRDTEEKWRNGVKNLELPWTNLFCDKNSDVVAKYAVGGYPTKVLIDAEGKIVEVFVGESDALYKKLDELFK